MGHINKDLKFDRFGDISFTGTDVDLISFNEEIIYQNVLDRLITNFNDYDLLPNYGADFSGSIGKKVDSELEFQIEDKVMRALTYDAFLSVSELSIQVLKEQSSVFVRVTVLGISTGVDIEDQIVVNTIFNTESGTLHASN